MSDASASGHRCVECGHPLKKIGDTWLHDIDWIEGWDFHMPRLAQREASDHGCGHHCPTCGHAVKVVGDTTQHYEPTGCFRIEDDHQLCEEEMEGLRRLRARVALYLDARSYEQASVVGGCLTAMKEALDASR